MTNQHVYLLLPQLLKFYISQQYCFHHSYVSQIAHPKPRDPHGPLAGINSTILSLIPLLTKKMTYTYIHTVSLIHYFHYSNNSLTEKFCPAPTESLLHGKHFTRCVANFFVFVVNKLIIFIFIIRRRRRR